MSQTRREVIFGATSILATPWLGSAQAAGASWEARHGMSSSQYQVAFYQMTARGFRLVHVAGYGVRGTVLYVAIWAQSPGPPLQARHGMPGPLYQATFDQFNAQGYRLRRVSGYSLGGDPHFAAIWEQAAGPAWQARHGMTGAEYQRIFDQLSAQDYRLSWVSGYPVAGTARYAAIWEQRAGAPWAARHGMSSSDYQQAFDQYSAQGYRLRMVSGYGVLGVPSFAAIWEKAESPPWEAHHDMSSDQYQQTFDRLVHGRGYRLTNVSGYDRGGQPAYAAIWEQS
jgi:hypothetical protein